MRPRPFLEPGSPHPTCLPSSPFLPMTPPSKLWVSGKGALEGGTTDPQGAPSSSQWYSTCSIGQGAGPPPGGRSSQRRPAPSTTWFLRPIPPPARPLWNPLSLHGSEAGPAAPPKGSFLSHFPWPRGVRSDSSPAPHGASFKLTPQGSPPPPSCPPPTTPIALDWLLSAPPLFSAVNTDHSHCMRTPTRSAFRVPFRRFRGQPGEAPTDQVPVAATRITQTSWLQPTQAVLFLYVRRLAQTSPATAETPPEHVFREVPGEDPGSLPSGWGLAGGVRHGTRWALGRRSFPCSGRAKAPCSAGCELQAELSFQRRPHSLARGPSLHLQSQKQRPSLSREPPVWFSAARKAPCN